MLRRWEQTIDGTLESISPENTQSLRSTLGDLCKNYESEAAAYLSQHSGAESFSDSWHRRVMSSILFLWMEQREVATGIMESINRGIEF